ncbi:MAG: P-type conjugative transfer protein TrbG [Novosphingobium sp.]|nr:MAG: P-type conjugative transfer protein TrbG [Novosphingobium sp.]
MTSAAIAAEPAGPPASKVASTNPQSDVATAAVPQQPRVSAPLRHARRARVSPALAQVARANRLATQQPASHGFVGAAQIYPFSDGAIYQVYAAPGAVTDIALQPGEGLIAVAAGDTARWVIGDTTSGAGETRRTHILAKPFAAGLSTNLVITTDRRAYLLQVTATARTAMASISWTYPADDLIALQRSAETAASVAPVAGALSLDRLNFDYRLTGDRPQWRPLRAFDDGRQTFIEFAPTLSLGEAPPLFLTGSKGEAELVNYRVSGRYYVVDRIFHRAELRLGTKDAKVVRIERLARGDRGGERP